MASGAFLPTTDELCNLARGANTRNVQLDPRTKTARMQQLKADPSSPPLLLTFGLSRHLLFA